jgi:hypothetical protein
MQMLLVFDNPVQTVGEQRQTDRLFKRRNRLDFLKPMGVRSGQDDHGNSRNPRIGALGDAERPAIHHRHAEIEHDDAGAAAGSQLRERIPTVGGFHHIESFEGQRARQQLPDAPVVVHHQNGPVGRACVHGICPSPLAEKIDDASRICAVLLRLGLELGIVLLEERADVVGHRQELLPLLLVERYGKSPQSIHGHATLLAHFQAHASTALALEPFVLRLEPLEFGFQIFVRHVTSRISIGWLRFLATFFVALASRRKSVVSGFSRTGVVRLKADTTRVEASV